MKELGPETGVVDPKQILELSKTKLKAVIEKYVDTEPEAERIEAYRKARRNHFLWNGIPNFGPTRLNDQVVDYTSIGIPIANKRRQSSPDYNFNIIRGDFMKAIAVIGSKAPDVTAVPDEADDEDQTDVARRADLVDRKVTKKADLNALQAELIHDVAITNTTFIYTPWVVDGERFGWTEEPVVEAEQAPFGDESYKCVHCGAENTPEQAMEKGVCEQCLQPLAPQDHQQPPSVDLPKVNGTKKYANGGVDFQIRNIFTVSYPFFAKNLTKVEWLRDQDDITESQAVEIFPDITKEILTKGSTSTDSYGKTVRQQVSSESGIQRDRSNTVLFTRLWVRPSFLNNLREDEVNVEDSASPEGKKQNLAQLLRERFQRGLRITLINGEIMDLFEESIDDCWVAVKPTVSKFISCDPLCHDTVPIQELVNRTGNIGVATLLRALPVTFIDSDMIDRQALLDREPISAEFLPVKRRTGQAMSDSIGQLPMARFSDQMMPFMGGIREMSRENNGITPPIFGGGQGVQTAREADIKKQQSLMQLRITYNNTRYGWAEARENAVRQYARYAPGQMKAEPGDGVFGKTAGAMVEVTDLVDGKFHFEPDEAMPRTFEDERESYREMTSGNTALPPELQAATGLTNAVNMPKVQKFFGMTGMYYPGKDERVKLRVILAQLLAEGPQQGPDGAPVPSVGLDPWDDAAMFAQLMAAWLNSDAGRQARKDNDQGFQNAVAFWQAAAKAANPQQPQAKLNVSYSADKDLGTAPAVLGQFGINLPPPTPQAVAPPLPSSPTQAKSTGGGGTPPAPAPGGQGLAVPEPDNPIPEPESPIPGS